ncbi:MAG TPA: acetyl-CoA carboxylase, carboxyltransferase subunit beta, partial [Alphaproteobacteria bacterium]|nr:acetyl-CoA carboxylase, carboxyltransferase subunit beta [Alphaproteobacteria bacterium]
RCQSCGAMLHHREFQQNHRVCPHCGFHMRLPARDRLNLLFDEGNWEAIPIARVVEDPLRFKDRKRYTDRLRESRHKTKVQDAILVGAGTIGGKNAVIAAFEFDFMGGSMGMAVGEGLVTAATEAVKRKSAFIAIPSSGGARMQEGILSLMQMARTTIGVEQVKNAGLPYIVVLTDPTTGGVTASFAMIGDIHIAEPAAVIGFAGQRVIEETIRARLPEGFQRSEYLKEHGMVDIVCARKNMKETLGRILNLLMSRPQQQLPPPSLGAEILNFIRQ